MKSLTAILFLLLTIGALAQYDDTSIVVDTATNQTTITAPAEEYEDGENYGVDTQHRFQRLHMDEEKLEALRRKSEFKYDDIDSPRTVTKPDKPASSSSSFQKFDATIFLWLLAALALVVVILQFSGIGMRQLFAPSKLHSKNNEDNETENIHDINYGQAIADAIATNNFSLATRLMYLQSLKVLADKGFIDWLPNKTNWQYVYELKQNDVRSEFKKITSMFEYVCYGNMQLTDAQFSTVHQTFDNFKKLVS